MAEHYFRVITLFVNYDILFIGVGSIICDLKIIHKTTRSVQKVFTIA